MMIEEVFGKTITDIRCKYGTEQGWLDTAECFIELDHQFYIVIPYGQPEDVSMVEPDAEAKTIFGDLSDIPTYHINKEGKTMAEVIETHKRRKQNILNRFLRALFGYDPPIKEYKPYKVEYQENKLKYVLNKVIIDYIWESEEDEKGFFELDNGCLISEQYMAPHGTGQAGLHYYENLNSLKERKGDGVKRYSELTKGRQ